MLFFLESLILCTVKFFNYKKTNNCCTKNRLKSNTEFTLLFGATNSNLETNESFQFTPSNQM